MDRAHPSSSPEPRAPKPDTVSVVIPCRNEAASVPQVIEAFTTQDSPILEILVVDNASTDDTRAVVAEYARQHPDVPLRALSCDRIGQPAALNAGIRAARGDVIVRMDAHVRPDPSYVRLAVETLRDTGAGVVGGVWRIMPGGDGSIAEAIARAVAHPLGAGDAAYRVRRGQSGRQAVDTVPFGCFLKDTWSALGGFNEHVLTNEDYEFNYRVRTSGAAVILDGRLRSTYVARGTLVELAAQYFRYGWWKTQMLRAHPAALRWRQAVPVGFVTLVIVLAVLSPIVLAARMWLLAVVVVYVAALAIGSWRISGGRRSWRIFSALPFVFATIHFSWAGGVLVNLATMAQWPARFRALASGRPVGG